MWIVIGLMAAGVAGLWLWAQRKRRREERELRRLCRQTAKELARRDEHERGRWKSAFKHWEKDRLYPKE